LLTWTSNSAPLVRVTERRITSALAIAAAACSAHFGRQFANPSNAAYIQRKDALETCVVHGLYVVAASAVCATVLDSTDKLPNVSTITCTFCRDGLRKWQASVRDHPRFRRAHPGLNLACSLSPTNPHVSLELRRLWPVLSPSSSTGRWPNVAQDRLIELGYSHIGEAIRSPTWSPFLNFFCHVSRFCFWRRFAYSSFGPKGPMAYQYDWEDLGSSHDELFQHDQYVDYQTNRSPGAQRILEDVYPPPREASLAAAQTNHNVATSRSWFQTQHTGEFGGGDAYHLSDHSDHNYATAPLPPLGPVSVQSDIQYNSGWLEGRSESIADSGFFSNPSVAPNTHQYLGSSDYSTPSISLHTATGLSLDAFSEQVQQPPLLDIGADIAPWYPGSRVKRTHIVVYYVANALPVHPVRPAWPFPRSYLQPHV
jgi:hypothetical protein